MSSIGVMVCGHGSRDPDAIREFEAVAQGIRDRLPQYDVDSGFLEFARPVIRDGLDNLRDRGVAEAREKKLSFLNSMPKRRIEIFSLIHLQRNELDFVPRVKWVKIL